MKHFLLVITCMACLYAPAIAGSKIPRWVPKKGYWVIESNIHRPDKHIIYLFNEQRRLVDKISIEGVFLDLSSKKVKTQLSKLLRDRLAAISKKDRSLFNLSK